MYILTFDIDWVPQFIVEDIIRRLRNYGLKATFFCTSPLDFKGTDNIELAIHPNFMSDSTQGDSEDEILKNLKDTYPEACGVRTHRLFWYSGLVEKIKNNGIVYDNSLFLPFHERLQPVDYFGIRRIPFWWSDNLHLINNYALDRVDLPNMQVNGLKVLNFHPIHIFLNTCDVMEFKKSIINLQPLENQKLYMFEKYVNRGIGMASFFDLMCRHIKRLQPETVRLKDVMCQKI